MSMTMIIIISLLVLNLGMTLIMFWIIHDLLAATKSLQDMEDIYKHTLELCNDQINEHIKALKSECDRENKLYESVKSWTKSIDDTYQYILEQYKAIANIHTKLLECWKGCEERYSQSYELFKHCSDNLKEVSFQLTDLANTSTEDEYAMTIHEACDTVCSYCPPDETKCQDCPVDRLMHREWTEDDYLEAVNTHPEEDVT